MSCGGSRDVPGRVRTPEAAPRMEIEYRDPSRRGKFIVAIGLVLALIAGGGAFFVISQAQQQAGRADLHDGGGRGGRAGRSPAAR